jgi:hypothetical protein
MVITGDHRFADAGSYLKFYRCMEGYIGDPANFDESTYAEAVPFDEVSEKKE